jgi:hypothetical protein
LVAAYDKKGKFVGVIDVPGPLSPVPDRQTTKMCLSGGLMFVAKGNQILSTDSKSKVKQEAAPTPVNRWGPAQFHHEFQRLYREKFKLGYPSMTFKDTSKWKSLLGGVDPMSLREILHFFFEQLELLQKMHKIPKPSPAVFHGWFATIQEAWVVECGPPAASGFEEGDVEL